MGSATAIRIIRPYTNEERAARAWLRDQIAWEERLDELRAEANEK